MGWALPATILLALLVGFVFLIVFAWGFRCGRANDIVNPRQTIGKDAAVTVQYRPGAKPSSKEEEGERDEALREIAESEGEHPEQYRSPKGSTGYAARHN